MVRVAENNARIQLSQFALRQGLDRALRAHGHKNRGFYNAVRCVENPCTRLCLGIGGNHLKPEAIYVDNTPPKRLKHSSNETLPNITSHLFCVKRWEQLALGLSDDI